LLINKVRTNMTPQERQLLESFLDRIADTAAPQQDPEAAGLIRERIGSRPDALYILTQTALIQDIALKQANARIQELQKQSQSQGEPQQASFLGRLFGTGPAPQPNQPPPPPQTQYVPPPAPQPQYAPPQGYTPAPQPGGASSFLRSAATTATGVAAGALAFEGIESLLHPQHGFGGGSGEGSGFLGGAPNETVINNYYDSPLDDRKDALADDSSDSTDSDDSTDDSDDTSFDDSDSDDDNV
jgi:hypothetical protein